MKKVILGSDHGGYSLKTTLSDFLQKKGYEIEDLGTDSKDPVDYPGIAKKVCERALQTKAPGLLVCGSGQGMCISANKVKGIRAAVCWDVTSAKLSRLHNDSNVLCLGGRLVGEEVAKELTLAWLETSFEGGRHERRIHQIEGNR